MKKLTEEIIEKIEAEVILMLLNCAELEERRGDYIWNANDPYYCEAFGIMRAMVALGHCYFGAINTPETKINAKWWFSELQEKVKNLRDEIGYKEALKIYNEKVGKVHKSQGMLIKNL